MGQAGTGDQVNKSGAQPDLEGRGLGRPEIGTRKPVCQRSGQSLVIDCKRQSKHKLHPRPQRNPLRRLRRTDPTVLSPSRADALSSPKPTLPETAQGGDALQRAPPAALPADPHEHVAQQTAFTPMAHQSARSAQPAFAMPYPAAMVAAAASSSTHALPAPPPPLPPPWMQA